MAAFSILDLFVVDLVVVVDHLLGQTGVGGHDRLDRLLDELLNGRAHPGQPRL